MVADPTEADFHVEEFITASKVQIRSSIDPISLQAKGAKKRVFKQALGSAIRNKTTRIYTHDVEVTLTWYVEESRRYQTHLIADLDNVIKAMLDAVTGPDGIMIDDNQIQSIKASWMTPGISGPGFELVFQSLMADDSVRRGGVSFVEFSRTRCFLLHDDFGDHKPAVVSAVRRMLALHDNLLDEGFSEEEAKGVLPIMRPFPRARLGLFTVHPESAFAEPE